MTDAISSEKDGSAESTKSKPRRGGRRPGAGRKPNLAKRLLKGFSRDVLLNALEDVDVRERILWLLRSKKEMTVLQTLVFLCDRVYGKPKQEIGISSGLHHTEARDPRLIGQPDYVVNAIACDVSRAYEEALARHCIAIIDVSPGGPQNQIESTVAIDAEGMDSGA